VIDLLPDQKTLPHSEESERAVLGGLLLEPSLLHQVRPRLEAEDFYHERHRLIFEAILALGQEADLRTVQAELERRGQHDEVGGIGYLSGLDLDLPDIGRIDVYADIVRERADRRRLIHQAGEAIRGSLDGGREASEVAADLLTECHRIVDRISEGSGFTSMGECVEAAVMEIELPDPPPPEGLVTGIKGIDELVGAMEPSTLWGIAGRPGQGKTSLALQCGALAAINKLRHVGIFTLEMPKRDLAFRLMAQRSGIDSKRIKRARLATHEWKRLHEVERAIRVADTLHIDETSFDIDSIEARTHQLAARVPLLAIVVDYLQLVNVKGRRFEREHLRVCHAAERLARLAKKLRILVIACSQFSRDVEKSDRLPNASDLREGGEEPMHGLLMIHRPKLHGEGDREIYSEEGKLVLGKHRSGDTGVRDFHFDGPSQTFWSPDDWRQRGAS
jgi:replicative DNA helicase